jgi:hypothetical protein
MRSYRGQSIDHDTRQSKTSESAVGKRSLTEGIVRRAARGAPSSAPEAALAQAGQDAGAPAEASVQRRVEAVTGADLSGVRVHTGRSSQEAADAVGARAYTLGQDVHFAAGEHQPGTPAGDHLLAHELAHAAQQGGGAGAAQFKLEIGAVSDPAEAQADRVADAVVAGDLAPLAMGAAGPALQRAPQEPSKAEREDADGPLLQAIADRVCHSASKHTRALEGIAAHKSATFGGAGVWDQQEADIKKAARRELNPDVSMLRLLSTQNPGCFEDRQLAAPLAKAVGAVWHLFINLLPDLGDETVTNVLVMANKLGVHAPTRGVDSGGSADAAGHDRAVFAAAIEPVRLQAALVLARLSGAGGDLAKVRAVFHRDGGELTRRLRFLTAEVKKVPAVQREGDPDLAAVRELLTEIDKDRLVVKDDEAFDELSAAIDAYRDVA